MQAKVGEHGGALDVVVELDALRCAQGHAGDGVHVGVRLVAQLVGRVHAVVLLPLIAAKLAVEPEGGPAKNEGAVGAHGLDAGQANREIFICTARVGLHSSLPVGLLHREAVGVQLEVVPIVVDVGVGCEREVQRTHALSHEGGHLVGHLDVVVGPLVEHLAQAGRVEAATVSALHTDGLHTIERVDGGVAVVLVGVPHVVQGAATSVDLLVARLVQRSDRTAIALLEPVGVVVGGAGEESEGGVGQAGNGGGSVGVESAAIVVLARFTSRIPRVSLDLRRAATGTLQDEGNTIVGAVVVNHPVRRAGHGAAVEQLLVIGNKASALEAASERASCGLLDAALGHGGDGCHRERVGELLEHEVGRRVGGEHAAATVVAVVGVQAEEPLRLEHAIERQTLRQLGDHVAEPRRIRVIGNLLVQHRLKRLQACRQRVG
mmetsp:Transcript_27824/g.89668  ORF Transcript_27824/g.89668 Transcript_27824/m.89668 type:complete len:434 (+) Transcript_27824:492-1793(+)